MESEKQNICIDIRYLTPNFSGVGRYIKNLTESILLSNQSRYNIFLLGEKLSFQMIQADPNSYQKIVTPYPATHHPKGDFWYNFIFPKQLKKHNIHLFHATAFMAPVVQLPCHLVTTICDRVAKRYPETMPWKFRTFLNFHVRSAMKKSSHIIAISNFTKKEIINEFHPVIPVSVTHLGCNQSRLDSHHLQQNTNPPFILVVGNIEPRKGIQEIINGYLLYRKKHPEKHEKLIFAGQTLYNYKINKKSFQDSMFKDSIIFTGYINDKQLEKYYKNAKLHVIPSKYEGFGLTVLEAMRSDAPILINDIEVLNEVGGNHTYKVNMQNEEALQKTLYDILDYYNIQNNNFNINYEKHLKNFSWEKCALKTLEVYEKTIS